MDSFRLAISGNPISISSTFTLPQDKRPNLAQVSTLSAIPVIDLSSSDDVDNSELVGKISHACEEYGFFQITNHGVPRELCLRTMAVINEFFSLPSEERAQFFTTDLSKKVKLMNYGLKVKGEGEGEEEEQATLMWSEAFIHPWDPNGDFATLLPENPSNYREVFVEYAKEMNKVVKRLLGLISQGLGLQKDFLESKLGQNPEMRAQSNVYPPCPEPELTLGLAAHTDLCALTVLMQTDDVCGLQVIKDGKWVAVNPVPDSFIINLGDQVEVMSNGRFKSVHHRVVTNKFRKRISLGIFYGPNRDSLIGPIEELIDEEHPPIYRKYKYSEFLDEFRKQEGTRRMIKEVFELRP